MSPAVASPIGALVLFIVIASSAAWAQMRGGPKVLPVIDKQDIRFVRLSVGAESFRKWVAAIAQDNYGFMWLGTDDGLYRYDGYTLRPYRHDPNDPTSLSSNTVKAIYKDRAGVLWIGTGYGGLDRLDPGHNAFTHYQHHPDGRGSLRDDGVICIYQDLAGALWVGTNGGLDRLDMATGRFVHYRYAPEDHTGSGAVTALSEDQRGNLLVGSNEGLYRLDRSSGQLSRFPHASIVAGGPDYVTDLQASRSGVLWVTSVAGTWLNAVSVKTGE